MVRAETIGVALEHAIQRDTATALYNFKLLAQECDTDTQPESAADLAVSITNVLLRLLENVQTDALSQLFRIRIPFELTVIAGVRQKIRDDEHSLFEAKEILESLCREMRYISSQPSPEAEMLAKYYELDCDFHARLAQFAGEEAIEEVISELQSNAILKDIAVNQSAWIVQATKDHEHLVQLIFSSETTEDELKDFVRHHVAEGKLQQLITRNNSMEAVLAEFEKLARSELPNASDTFFIDLKALIAEVVESNSDAQMLHIKCDVAVWQSILRQQLPQEYVFYQWERYTDDRGHARCKAIVRFKSEKWSDVDHFVQSLANREELASMRRLDPISSEYSIQHC